MRVVHMKGRNKLFTLIGSSWTGNVRRGGGSGTVVLIGTNRLAFGGIMVQDGLEIVMMSLK